MTIRPTKDQHGAIQNCVGEVFRKAWGAQPASTAGRCEVQLDGVLVGGAWERIERLAGEWWTLDWQAQSTGPWDLARLRGWADRVVAAVPYLSEPLHVWEIDEPQGIAVVRSDRPARQGDEREYFELVCRAGEGHLQRWSVAEDGSRRRVVFPLVNETVFRALADLAIVLN